MSSILSLRKKAAQEKMTIVLPEGDDPRIVEAAAYAASEEVADIILLGHEDKISANAADRSVVLDGVRTIDPSAHRKRQDLISSYYELRKHKGMTHDEAEELLLGNHVFYGAMMVREGEAHGFVAGASHPTADVARAGIQCINIDREIGSISSSFLMELEDCPFGEDGLFIFGDCGIIPYPSSKQLAGIAVATSDLFGKLFPLEPRVALLSYSTKGSAEGDSISSIRDALERIKKKRPELMVDGELQLDAAIVPQVAEMKCSGSEVAGKANVLIFPNLDAGNISYKLTQRLAKARAVGPLMQGMKKPCCDLSRGCCVEEIIDAITVTAVRAQGCK